MSFVFVVQRPKAEDDSPVNRPGHEDTPASRSDDVAIDGQATARGATGSAHWQQPGHSPPHGKRWIRRLARSERRRRARQ